jgi:hypothetical protein
MSESENTLTRLAEAAFLEASKTVIRRARQTGTPILIWEDGRILELSADRLDPTEPTRVADRSGRGADSKT